MKPAVDNAESEFTLAATGDAIIMRSMLPLADWSQRFDAILKPLQKANATVTNLEVVVNQPGSYATLPQPVRDQYQYLGNSSRMALRADPHVLDQLSGMGINMFATANNHSNDFGRKGMEQTMDELETRNLAYAGLGTDLSDARKPSYITTARGRVGHVHATTSIPPDAEASSASAFLPGRPGINPLHVNWTYKIPPDYLETLREIGSLVGIDDIKGTWLGRELRDTQSDSNSESSQYSFMHMTFESVNNTEEAGISLSVNATDRKAVLDQIRESDSQADWTVATVHSHQGPHGTRNVSQTPGFLETFARDCIDAGADAFICTGSHVLRGIEIYANKPIFYSLGNFIFHFETQEQLPAEVFEYYDLDDDSRPSAAMDARFFDGDTPKGNLANDQYWMTILPTCHYDKDGKLKQIELLPCELGQHESRGKRGTPKQATDEEAERIFETLRDLSEEYETTIEQDGESGKIIL